MKPRTVNRTMVDFFVSTRFVTVEHTVKASNFGSYGYIQPLFQKGLLISSVSYRKMKGVSCRKNVRCANFVQFMFCTEDIQRNKGSLQKYVHSLHEGQS